MPNPDEMPVNHVINMRNQGLSNNQIIQNLQRFGFSMEQINNAINQADIKVGIHHPDPAMFDPDEDFHGRPDRQEGASQRTAPAHMPEGSVSRGPSRGHGAGGSGEMNEEIEGPGDLPEDMSEGEERIHEVAEAIIEEKWADLMESVNRIIEWKDHIESRVSKAEQQIASLTGSFDKLHEGVLGKIHDYDKGLSIVTTEIKALEKVFQKILPGFVENVHELSRITEGMKKR